MCRTKEVLKEAHIIEYLKRELKKVLETKTPREQLNQVCNIILNSEYQFGKLYFQQGLYSVLAEIAKADIMQLEVLQFFNKAIVEEKIVNELYQRGLIQKAVTSLTDSDKP